LISRAIYFTRQKRRGGAAALPLRFWREGDRAGNPLICRTRRTRDGSVPGREALRLI